MYGFWDAIDLAREGSYGDLDVERQRLRDFLVAWSTPGQDTYDVAVKGDVSDSRLDLQCESKRRVDPSRNRGE
jgi:hypothetical protein